MEVDAPLFVYGTLRPEIGHPLGVALAATAVCDGLGSVGGRLYDQGEFPVAVPSEANGERIVGEFWRLAPEHELWKELDAYEDYEPTSPETSAFVRRSVGAMRASGELVQAQIYWFRGDTGGMSRIVGGDYLRRED